MAEVNLTVNGATYEVACEPGQEQRLTELAARIDSKVAEIAEQSGQAGQSRLLLMAALMLIDAAEETGGKQGANDDALEQAQDYVTSVFEQMTDRINKITDHL